MIIMVRSHDYTDWYSHAHMTIKSTSTNYNEGSIITLLSAFYKHVYIKCMCID